MSQPPKAPPVRAVPDSPAKPRQLRAGPAAGQPQPQPQPSQQPAQPPAPPQAPAAEAHLPPVRATAKPARTKRRHWALILFFLLVAVAPPAVAAFYMWARAADQYASFLGFSVRSEEQNSAVELLGGITDLSGSSSSDTDILYSYLTSQELVSKVNARVDLAEIWSRVPVEQDPIFAYDPTGTIEDLVSHWERKVSIVYDTGTRLLELRVLAFDADDAKAVAEAILVESTEMINQLSDIAREDAIKYSRDELEVSIERLKEARLSLTQFRNRTQIVDPSIDTQNQMGVLVTLQQQLADSLIELDLLSDTTRIDDPRISQANRRVEVIQARIEAERQKLGLGTGAEGGVVFADLVGEYESLIVDREFAETAYTTALATFDGAVAEARRQSRYLAAHIRPTLAQKAEYPERSWIVMLIAVFSFLTWGILSLVYYSLRDRA